MRISVCLKPFTYTSFYIIFVLGALFVTLSMKVANKSFGNVVKLRYMVKTITNPIEFPKKLQAD